MSELRDYAEAVLASISEHHRYFRWMKELSYRPGTKFKIKHGGWGKQVVVSIPIKDVDTGKYDFLSGGRDLREGLTKKEFFAEVWNCITEMEQHEQKEWFRISGKFWADPHPFDGFINGVRTSNVWQEDDAGASGPVGK